MNCVIGLKKFCVVMERTRDLRRGNVSSVNGFPRGRERISSLRGSPDDGQAGFQEAVRLRDRERLQRKDRDGDFSKKRRIDRSLTEHKTDGGVGESSKENQSTDSIDEEYFEEEEETKVHQRNRMNQPCPPSSSSLTNNRRSLRTPQSSPVYRAAADEIIGVPVPRRARSASAKRLHEYCTAGSGAFGEDFCHRSFSPSAMTAGRICYGSTSPLSFNASIEKNMKSAEPRLRDFNNGSNSRPSSVMGDDVEIEVAEVLFDLMKQSQSQSYSSSDGTKAVDDGLIRLKAEGDKDGSDAFSVQNEPPIRLNAVAVDAAKEFNKEGRQREKFPDPPDQELLGGGRFVNKEKVGTPKESESQSCPENACEILDPTARKADDATIIVENEKVAKLQIDLMAPPPPPSSPERVALAETVTNPKVTNQNVQKGEIISENRSSGYAVSPQKGKIRDINSNQLPNLDVEESRNVTLNVSDHGIQECWGQEQKNQASTSLLRCPIGMSGWPGVISHPGYVPPLQAVLPVNLSAGSSTPMQPPQFKFPEPQPKRHATHQYIAHNIHRHQQLIKECAFSGPAAAATLYGSKPMNLKSTHKYITGSQVQSLATISNRSATDKSSEIAAFNSATNSKLLPPQAPNQASGANNFLHGSALIFPIGHHQTTVMTPPGPPQSDSVLSNSSLPSNSAGRPPMNFFWPRVPATTSFNHPNLPSYDASSYMAILQNSCPIPFTENIPIPNLKGGTQSQTMPYPSSSFYSSPVCNASKKEQHLSLPHASFQSFSQNASTSNGSPSHKKPPSQQHITTKVGVNSNPRWEAT